VDSDRTFLEAIYPALVRYYQYVLARDAELTHVVGLINPDESGEDNSPRFDAALGLPPQHTAEENNTKRFALIERNRQCGFRVNECMRNFFWVKDVPFNAYLVENLECMATLANEFGNDADAQFFSAQATIVRDGMRSCMREDGLFWNVYGKDSHHIKVKTWALFAPLVAGALSESEAKLLVDEHLNDASTFWSTYPIPTTAMNEESFNPEEAVGTPTWLHPNWRGPVWMAPNWFAYRGLMRYGFHKEAETIKERSIMLLARSGFREYFHPMTGEGMGARDFTWGGLVLDMNEAPAHTVDAFSLKGVAQ
jgi:glycogen debranching enzyme